MEQIPCAVDHQGRVTIPAAWRKTHGLKTGSTVIMTLHEDHLEIQTPDQSLSEAQQIVAAFGRPKKSPVTQLLADRRRAARNEAKEAARHAKGH